jgi:sRNA-binding protein
MLPTHETLAEEVRKRNAAVNWLLETYPLAFDLRNRRPLKENIVDDIIADAKPNMPSQAELQMAFKHYTHWGSYLTATLEGSACIDLDGNVSGSVSAARAEQAKNFLLAAQKKQQG